MALPRIRKTMVFMGISFPLPFIVYNLQLPEPRYPRRSRKSAILPPRDGTRLVRPRRSDLRRAHGLRHPMEDDHALSTAAGRERFCGAGKTAVDVLPVVHHPDVARG